MTLTNMLFDLIVDWIGLLIFFPLPLACVGPFLGCSYNIVLSM